MDVANATDTYLNLLLSLPHIDPMTVLAIFFLTLARIIPIMTVAPFLGAKNLPMAIRMMFSLSLVAIFLPRNLMEIHTQIPFALPFIALMCKELLIGFAIGFLATAPFYIAQMAGSLIDHSRGASSLQVTDPTTQSQASDIGLLYNYILLVVFFALGGPFLFFNGLADSYHLFPVDKLFSSTLFDINLPLWNKVSQFANMTMELAAQLAAPALIGILLTNLFLGIANRLAAQVQIVFLGMPLSSWVGIALMTAAWGLTIQVMGKGSISWIKTLNQLIQQIGNYFVK